jgi:hypothetical protein
LSADAFAADPRLADDLQAAHRSNAACSAALAAAGQGEDAARLDDKEKARLRKQALDWLKADLVLRTRQLESGKPAARAAVQQTLRDWQKDSDLAGSGTRRRPTCCVPGWTSTPSVPGSAMSAWRRPALAGTEPEATAEGGVSVRRALQV